MDWTPETTKNNGITRDNFWPRMRDVNRYAQTCLICQQDKVKHQRQSGLLAPLLAPSHPWESISMDFISTLPNVRELGFIMVVVDHFSKYGWFIAAPIDCLVEKPHVSS